MGFPAGMEEPAVRSVAQKIQQKLSLLVRWPTRTYCRRPGCKGFQFFSAAKVVKETELPADVLMT